MGEIALSLFYGGCTVILGFFAYNKLKKEFAHHQESSGTRNEG